jgi:hypothetical protein
MRGCEVDDRADICDYDVDVYDDFPSLFFIAECFNDAGDDVDDIGVLHGVMAAAGFGVAVTDSTMGDAGAAGGGGRRGREKSVLDPSWRLRYKTCHFTYRFFVFDCAAHPLLVDLSYVLMPSELLQVAPSALTPVFPYPICFGAWA